MFLLVRLDASMRRDASTAFRAQQNYILADDLISSVLPHRVLYAGFTMYYAAQASTPALQKSRTSLLAHLALKTSLLIGIHFVHSEIEYGYIVTMHRHTSSQPPCDVHTSSSQSAFRGGANDLPR
eukprot:6195051-Pleurochrysis_carterae.AAC.3